MGGFFFEFEAIRCSAQVIDIERCRRLTTCTPHPYAPPRLLDGTKPLVAIYGTRLQPHAKHAVNFKGQVFGIECMLSDITCFAKLLERTVAYDIKYVERPPCIRGITTYLAFRAGWITEVAQCPAGGPKKEFSLRRQFIGLHCTPWRRAPPERSPCRLKSSLWSSPSACGKSSGQDLG